ncbi:hypothetical protein FN976_27275 [Caenimonas sedimenti]|uniref:Uncharacterized protein n=1 Tax=Caenimonas sedimenti TaxID=2596921 RepID=A0A562ZF82_9BURK|nr:hypothetical protein [Caenimonas sedimenti]TWO65511.1 hypothetical protein FN976_27275 [Caenimonas sedimenti]
MQSSPTFTPIPFGTNDVQIMTGTFDEFTFDDVIQVLGLSRQCLRFLVRRGESAVSEVLLKAGQVLDARMSSSSEPETVFVSLSGSAIRGSGLSFAVYHTQPTGPFPLPRARLSDLYARSRRVQPQSVSANEPTLRLTAQQAQAPAAAAQAPAAQATAPAARPPAAAATPDHLLPTVSLPATSADTLSRAVLADLQPVLRQELQAAIQMLREQSQALHTLDGRLQALPQLVASEVRLALAQQERRSAAAPAPAPVAPAIVPPPTSPALLAALGAGFMILLGVMVVLVVKLLR